MTASKAKTYSGAVAYGDGFELYEFTGWLNAGRTIGVFVWGQVRFRADTKKRTTIKQLEAEGWKRR